MRRTYFRERYLALVERLRAAVPDLALGTDIIVGFPGETEEDFAQTLDVVEEVRYDSAFTFIYSPRAGTEAADHGRPGRGRGEHERLERLVEVVQRIAAERTLRVSAASRRCSSGNRAAPTRRSSVDGRGEHDRELRGRRRPRRHRPGEIEGATSTTLRGTWPPRGRLNEGGTLR